MPNDINSSPSTLSKSHEVLARAAVDTGGTFTDILWLEGDTLRAHKLLSTPEDPSAAVLGGLQWFRGTNDAGRHAALVIHGTTVVTNALLQRRGARTAFITTQGFEDLLALGRQARPEVYALHVVAPPPLVQEELCFGVRQRQLPDGSELIAVDTEQAAALARALTAAGAESAAICFLHAYADGGPEQAFAMALQGALQSAGAPIVDLSLSHQCNPEPREFERASTTTANAFVRPLASRYLSRLETSLSQSALRILLSSGGTVPASHAAHLPVETALSGPAGGVVGARATARLVGLHRIITFDMGGTSTDVALCDGEMPISRNITVASLPLRIASLDIHTVGAGGGSIGWLDAGGGLHAGPQSAGADPGPACYGRGGTLPTVTDANLIRGHLLGRRFLGGEMALEEQAARTAMAPLAEAMGTTIEVAAQGLCRVANAVMERALKHISVAQGKDPRNYALVSFGGAGGMHACELAEALRMSTILIPPHPGLLSALGMLMAGARYDLTQSVLTCITGITAAAGLAACETAFARLEAEGNQLLRADTGAISTYLERSASLRYQGQSFELEVPWSAEIVDTFHQRHLEAYGYALNSIDGDSDTVEVVTVRVVARALPPPIAMPISPARPHQPAPNDVTDRGVAVYDRASLPAGAWFEGPALLTEYSATTFVAAGWRAEVHETGAVLLRLAPVEGSHG